MPAKLLDFPNPDLSNIPGMLRLFADDIENEVYPGAQFVVAVVAYPGHQPAVLTWGRVNTLEALGAVTAAAHKLIKVPE